MSTNTSTASTHTWKNPTSYTSSSENTGFSWGQVSSGPQAYARAAMSELLEVLVELMNLYNQQCGVEADANAQCAKANAQLTKDAANDRANQTYCQMGMSFASAGISAIGIGVSYGGYKGIKTEINETQMEQENLSGLNEHYKDAKNKGPGQNGTDETSSMDDELTREAIQNRKNELLSGDRSLTEAAKKKQEDIDVTDEHGTTTSKNLNKAAIEDMSPEELREFDTKLSAAQENASRSLNNSYTKYQTQQTTVKMYQELTTSIANGTAQAFQAKYQVDEGNDQAIAALASNNADTAKNLAQTMQGNVSKIQEEIMQALNYQVQSAASNNVRG
ncbi:MAG: hypothetical protein EBZ47_03210 [Chlamydiae bacterium]|nr:hypothetical protein [Chlamydiota bacterium]